MNSAVQPKGDLRTFLEMIKFEHSIFALPFAAVGMTWGSISVNGVAWPGWWPCLWILVAMVSCRTAAMAFNRIHDREIDALNPRTATRAIPAGLLQLKRVNLYFFASCAIFFVAAGMLNMLALILAPVALGTTIFYSTTKRFTPLCHFVLGLSLGIAPAAAWIGVTGTLGSPVLPLVGAVLLWTAGFDIIYSLQDEDFDREHKLRSLPETLGGRRALAISRMCHVGSVALLMVAGLLGRCGILYFAGVAAASALLIFEQSLVRHDDLSKVNLAFFTLNGFVSLGFGAFAIVEGALRG